MTLEKINTQSTVSVFVWITTDGRLLSLWYWSPSIFIGTITLPVCDVNIPNVFFLEMWVVSQRTCRSLAGSGYMGIKRIQFRTSSSAQSSQASAKHKSHTSFRPVSCSPTRTYTHVYGKAVSRNTQASHPELSERSGLESEKEGEEKKRWGYKDS